MLHGRILYQLGHYQSETGLFEEADASLEKCVAILDNGDEDDYRKSLLWAALKMLSELFQDGPQ